MGVWGKPPRLGFPNLNCEKPKPVPIPKPMNIPKPIALYGLTTLSISTILVTPAIAHKVQISGDIGGTLHIEPNDNPRAGEPSLAWFALTRQGGEVIPLEACNCQFAIYTQSGDAIVESPTLEPISAEGYNGIPGAEITFPQVGAYELVLQGEPLTPEDFQPFEFRFPVTVAAGQAAPNPQATAEAEPTAPSAPAADVESAQPNSPANLFWLIPIALLLIGGAIAFFSKKNNPKQKSDR
jgi:hypothetical protein